MCIRDRLKITGSRYFTPSGRWIQEKNYFKENKYGVFLDKDRYNQTAVSYTHLRAHETVLDLVCRLLLEKKKQNHTQNRHMTHSNSISYNKH